jgi:hypothetical protein
MTGWNKAIWQGTFLFYVPDKITRAESPNRLVALAQHGGRSEKLSDSIQLRLDGCTGGVPVRQAVLAFYESNYLYDSFIIDGRRSWPPMGHNV